MRGLLLDSGDTVMQPRGGRWDPRFDFEEVVTRHLGGFDEARLEEAIAAGDRFMAAWDPADTDFKAGRARYHRVVLAALGVDEPSDELIEELDRPMPFHELVAPFDDVWTHLPRFREQGWALAIVADTGSGMVDVYRHYGLHDLFEVFVISAELGCAKPDPRMYRTASDALGLEPSDCLFVDDRAVNVRGALALGYTGVGISRYGPPPAEDGELRWVRHLEGLAEVLAEVVDRS